jgi:hypothetical protein
LKKRFIVPAIFTALVIGMVGLAAAEDERGSTEHSSTAVPVEPREQGQLPAPPKPPRQQPIERVVTATPK